MNSTWPSYMPNQATFYKQKLSVFKTDNFFWKIACKAILKENSAFLQQGRFIT